MGVISEFKAFAVKGNVVDMAVGIIIGAAFGKIVSSFVGDVVMPPIGLLIGGVDFGDLAITLKAAQGDVPATDTEQGRSAAGRDSRPAQGTERQAALTRTGLEKRRLLEAPFHYQ